MDEREKKERKADELRPTNGNGTSDHLREAHQILQELYRIVGATPVAPVVPRVPTTGFVGWTPYGNY
jgi:hypothetical protein